MQLVALIRHAPVGLFSPQLPARSAPAQAMPNHKYSRVLIASPRAQLSVVR
jgi:hypothetical protein